MKSLKIFTLLVILLNKVCFGFQTDVDIGLKIPASSCDSVVYVNQDDPNDRGQVSTTFWNGSYYYVLESSHDFDHDYQGDNKRKNFICYSKAGDSPSSFSIPQVWGYWQYVNVDTPFESRAINGTANMTIDNQNVICNDSPFWKVYWTSGFNPHYSTQKCAQSNVHCVYNSLQHSCVDNGFESDPPTGIIVNGQWRTLYFNALEAYDSDPSKHDHVDMTITHRFVDPTPDLSSVVFLISSPNNNYVIYDANGNPATDNITLNSKVSPGSWYRLAKPNDSNNISLKVQAGMDKSSANEILEDGTYSCTATISAENGASGSSTFSGIILGDKSNLPNHSTAYPKYLFTNPQNMNITLNSNKFDLKMDITCVSSDKSESTIVFNEQITNLYIIKHF